MWWYCANIAGGYYGTNTGTHSWAQLERAAISCQNPWSLRTSFCGSVSQEKPSGICFTRSDRDFYETFMNILNHLPYTWCQQTQQIFVKVLAQLFTHISQLYNHSAFVSGPDRIPVGTPTTTPIPSPTRVATPSPPPANLSPESATLQHHPWGGRELPLEEEEEPHSERQEQQAESVYV